MKVVWTEFAVLSLKEIFDYYKNAVNRRIATAIRKKILLSVTHLKKFPESGQKEILLEDLEMAHRYILSGHFKIIYRILEDKIIITDVFDTRQDPSRLTNP